METVVVIFGLAIVCGLNLRATRKLGELGEEQRALLDEVLQELGALRSALVDSGDVERFPKLPPPGVSTPALAKTTPLTVSARALPPVAQPVSVTRDDHPDHTRPTMEAPSPTLSPTALRIAAATRGPDAEGEATVLRGGTQPDEDPDAVRETGEEFTQVYSRCPDEADARIPGVPVAPKPATVRRPHSPPRKVRADRLNGQEGGEP
jgi:hypothetical protein